MLEIEDTAWRGRRTTAKLFEPLSRPNHPGKASPAFQPRELSTQGRRTQLANAPTAAASGDHSDSNHSKTWACLSGIAFEGKLRSIWAENGSTQSFCARG